MRTLECIGNPVGGALIGNAVWKGVYLKTLLDGIQVRPESIRARFQAADDYFTSVYNEWILHPQTMLIYEMNGEPLTREHGFPVRILMPGLYGQKNPKWLTHIEFIDKVEGGYWEKQGWSDIADVQTNSIIRQPANLASVAGVTVPVFGVAFAGSRKIAAVEVQVDEGDWQAATLVQADSSLVWTQWSFDWPAAAGKHTLSVRATDEKGFVQTGRSQALLGDAYPAGTSAIHSVVVKVAVA
jgi:DMSO/TMAO reductase YedYZ molybdopterin-dependent catalytic subunit